jgi:hypothetical protein
LTELEDSFARLLLLPNKSFLPQLVEHVQNLAKVARTVNAEFAGTKMLMRASLFNFYNEPELKEDKGDKDVGETRDAQADGEKMEEVKNSPFSSLLLELIVD